MEKLTGVWTSGWPGALHYFVIAFEFVFVFVFVLVFVFVFVNQIHCIA